MINVCACQERPAARRSEEASRITVRSPPRAVAGQRWPRLEQVAALCNAHTTLLNVANARPLEALVILERNLPKNAEAREQWKASARIAAVMGSCPRSLGSFKSGLKHWIRFVEIIHGTERAAEATFPPCLDDVLAWSNTFR